MTKIGYFRQRIQECYALNEWAKAAAAGEALLAEHAGNQSNKGMTYANDLYNLARVYDEWGQITRAVELYAHSARITFIEEGETLSFARRLNNLAALLNTLGKSDSAYRLFKQATDIRRIHLDSGDPELADSLYNLGNAAVDVAREDEAMQLHKEALTLRESIGTLEDIVCSLHSIAFLHETKNEYEEALKYAETALARAKGTEAYVGACFYLAELYNANEHYAEAEPLYTAIMARIEQETGRGHSAYVTVATRLANTLAGMEKYEESLDTQREIHHLLKEKADGDHLFIANCMRSMAILHKRLNQPDEAEQLMLRSMKIRKRVMGEQARDLITDAVFMIDLYITGQQLDKALDMLVFVLIHNGGGHPDFERVLTTLTEIYTRGGHQQFINILQEMENLNSRGRLWEIVNYWAEWERQED